MSVVRVSLYGMSVVATMAEVSCGLCVKLVE